MSKYLFLGKIIPNNIAEEILKKTTNSMQDAAITLQWNLIEGLECNFNEILDIYTLLPVDSYPKYYSDKSIESMNFSHKAGANDYLIGHNNIHIIKRLSIEKNI